MSNTCMLQSSRADVYKGFNDYWARAHSSRLRFFSSLATRCRHSHKCPNTGKGLRVRMFVCLRVRWTAMEVFNVVGDRFWYEVGTETQESIRSWYAFGTKLVWGWNELIQFGTYLVDAQNWILAQQGNISSCPAGEDVVLFNTHELVLTRTNVFLVDRKTCLLIER
jgi:hypothetical protein